VMLAGCTTGPPESGTSTSVGTTATPPPFQPPGLTIHSPGNGSYVPEGNITVAVTVDHFSLVNKFGEANVAGEGHIHYFLDVLPPTEPGKPAVTAPGTYVPATATRYTWQNVPAGIHVIGVELVNNDHTPLAPPVTTTITVMSAMPRVRILSPGDVTIAGPNNFTVTVAVENFRLVDALGTPNVAGEGHIHYFLDVEPPTDPGVPAITSTGRYVPTTDTSYQWINVGGGFHIVAVELVNNDHTPLVPPATDSITVIVGREGAGAGGGGGGY